MSYYVLNGHEPQEAELMEWAAWFAKRSPVARDFVGSTCLVSTVFIGIGDVWFETCVFWEGPQVCMERYSTWDEAIAGHKAIVEKMKQEQQA